MPPCQTPLRSKRWRRRDCTARTAGACHRLLRWPCSSVGQPGVPAPCWDVLPNTCPTVFCLPTILLYRPSRLPLQLYVSTHSSLTMPFAGTNFAEPAFSRLVADMPRLPTHLQHLPHTCPACYVNAHVLWLTLITPRGATLPTITLPPVAFMDKYLAVVRRTFSAYAVVDAVTILFVGFPGVSRPASGWMIWTLDTIPCHRRLPLPPFLRYRATPPISFHRNATRQNTAYRAKLRRCALTRLLRGSEHWHPRALRRTVCDPPFRGLDARLLPYRRGDAPHV